MGNVQWEGQGPSKEKRGTAEKLACVSRDPILGNYSGDLCTSVEGDLNSTFAVASSTYSGAGGTERPTEQAR